VFVVGPAAARYELMVCPQSTEPITSELICQAVSRLNSRLSLYDEDTIYSFFYRIPAERRNHKSFITVSMKALVD